LTVVKGLSKSGWEPRWGDPTSCLRVASALSIANYFEVSAGVALSPSPIEDLRNVRNHLVHRKVDIEEMKDVGRNEGMADPITARGVLHELVRPGVPLIVRWISELRVMAELAAS
jgi:hypothetical protein